MELRSIPVDELDLTLGRLRLLPESDIRKMVESLRCKGQLTPLVAAERPEGLVLVDGFVRRMASVRLGIEKLMVEVTKLDDVQMKAQVYLRNRDRGLMLLEECRLVHELNRAEGLSQVEIAALLEHHRSWACRRLGLYRALSPNLRDDGTLERLGGGSIRRLALLPQRNQEELMAVVLRDHLGPTEAATLFDLWRKSREPGARAYLLEHPREAIRLHRELAKKGCTDPRLGQAGQYIVDGLNALEQIAGRMLHRLRKGTESLTIDGAGVLAPVLGRSESASRDAFELIRTWLKEVESDDEQEQT